MTPAKPSLDLLRTITDEHVLRALLDEPRLTRAEMAVRTGISKPTVADSVARLAAAGLVHDTGERTSGRGRIGTYYALDAAAVGTGLAVGIAPGGVVVEAVDARGDVVARGGQPVPTPARPADVRRALQRAVRPLAAAARLAVVSAADPVDRATGRLVQLPDAPFLVGDLSPADVLAPLVDGPVTVDNDVNWAARAERAARGPAAPDDFAYLYLGEGLGCAVVSDGGVRRGASGLAGEIAHLVTVGPRGRAIRFTDLFELLQLRQDGSTAIDVAKLQAAVARSARVRIALADGIAGVLAALVAVSEPALVLLGGPWGRTPDVVDEVARSAAALPRPVRVEPAALGDDAPLAGARQRAIDQVRDRALALARERVSRPAPAPSR